jgi:hypothetical protein
MAYQCISDDGNEAQMVLTDLTNGDVTSLCADCLPLFILAWAAQIAPGEDEPVDAVPVDPITGDDTDEDGAEGVAVPDDPGWTQETIDDTLGVDDDPDGVNAHPGTPDELPLHETALAVKRKARAATA